MRLQISVLVLGLCGLGSSLGASGCGEDLDPAAGLQGTTAGGAAGQTATAMPGLDAGPALAECGTFAGGGGATTGLRTLAVAIDGVSRTYHLRVPASGDPTLPIVFAFHGTSGSSVDWIADGLNILESAVGEGAWLVYPEALPGNDGLSQWVHPVDIRFFDAILAELAGCFDPNRVFVTGHSSGGGMAHLLACERGNVVRGSAPVSGLLLDDACVGQTAIFQVHGGADTLVPASTGEPAKDFWAARNGCDLAQQLPSQHAQCETYAACDSGFPVHWCEHTEPLPAEGQGHQWPAFAGPEVWKFFQSLDVRAPSDQAPDRMVSLVAESSRVARFSLSYPADLVGTPQVGAASLYPPGTPQPFSGAPLHLISLEFEIGAGAAGQTVAYEVPVNVGSVVAGDYTFAVNLYIEGGTYPIPLADHDYVALAEVSFEPGVDLDVVAPIPLVLVEGFAP